MQTNKAPTSTTETLLSYLKPVYSLFGTTNTTTVDDKKQQDREIYQKKEMPTNKRRSSRKIATKPAPLEKPQVNANNTKSRSRTTYKRNITPGIDLADEVMPPLPERKKKTGITSYFPSVISLFKPPEAMTTYSAQLYKRMMSIFPTFSCSPPQDFIIKNLGIFPEENNKSEKAQVKELLKKQNDAADAFAVKKILFLSEKIKEHASNRIDLFFLLLIAVYNQQVSVTKTTTTLQHGIGSKETGTHACHSSLFPSVKFHPLPNTDSDNDSDNEDENLITLENTHFADQLNVTANLPVEVNEFDSILEGGYRQSKYVRASLDILNRAAKGEITPKEGMEEFIIFMHEFFTTFNKDNQPLVKTNGEICRLQKEGTLESTSQTSKVINADYKKALERINDAGIITFKHIPKEIISLKQDYLHAMLRLTSQEIALVKENPKHLFKFYKRIQDEIFNSKSVKAQAKIDKENRPLSYKRK